MNYKRIYNAIIVNRQSNPITEGYVERHHIVPKSLGGSDDENNLICLSAREHFLCHYLLAKMYPKETNEWYKMNHAFMMMRCNPWCTDRYYNSKLYESLRGNFSSVMSWAQTGKRNSQYGSVWISNCSTRTSKKIKNTGDIPDGWVLGRNVWKTQDLVTEKARRKEKIAHERRAYAESLWNEYVNGNYNSLNEFVKSGYYDKSLQSLTRLFLTHLPGYTPQRSIQRKHL